MGMKKPKGKRFVRIQLMHKPQAHHAPYRPKEIENALQKLNLREIRPRYWGAPWGPMNKQGYIRHETGVEIVLLATALVSLATAIVQFVATVKKKRPETKVQITVNSADELKNVLSILERR